MQHRAMFAQHVEFWPSAREKWAVVFFWGRDDGVRCQVGLQRVSRDGPTGKNHALITCEGQFTAKQVAEFAARCCELMKIDEAHAWEVEAAVKMFVGDLADDARLIERGDGTTVAVTVPE